MLGLIVALQCGIYSVLSEGQIFDVPARGSFRNKNIKPVVGDYIELNKDDSIIENVKERKSFLKRPTIANIDQMVILHSMVEPEFSYHLMFKYLTYSNMNGIPAFIVLTKIDKAESSKVDEIVKTFEKLKIKVFCVNSKKGVGIEDVKSALCNKVSCLIGQSGVGKSSLLNAIDPSYQRSVGEYSKSLGRGKHKTKEIVLLPYLNGFIADTPGFSSLDLDLFKEDLAKFYPGFINIYSQCYFSDCLHLSEQKCAVKSKIESKEIPEIVYEVYLKLLNEAKSNKERYL